MFDDKLLQWQRMNSISLQTNLQANNRIIYKSYDKIQCKLNDLSGYIDTGTWWHKDISL